MVDVGGEWSGTLVDFREDDNTRKPRFRIAIDLGMEYENS